MVDGDGGYEDAEEDDEHDEVRREADGDGGASRHEEAQYDQGFVAESVREQPAGDVHEHLQEGWDRGEEAQLLQAEVELLPVDGEEGGVHPPEYVGNHVGPAEGDQAQGQEA